MARSVVYVRTTRDRFVWPDGQLNVWTLIMLVTGSLLLGVFAEFMQIQSQMGIGTPWLFPFGVTTGALTVALIIAELLLIMQRRLLPAFMMISAFILFVLFLTGLIETAIQLFGPDANVNSNCQNYVFGNQSTGPTMNTLAWLEQNNICQCWLAAFAFWIIGDVFLIWMMIMASQVSRGFYE
ncbi:hypothetical protein BDY21DRAFT_192870 [Lineolata rhizophorae]|uniref:Marvel domain-containing protein n=1 Tax=Lineolata rhizophorae TaxID=578093 RepID=A0A6A6P6V2_9PEZI|nr:hypothetical protein BDY21DRAFT_192870 [Lineolata rhizophorae]